MSGEREGGSHSCENFPDVVKLRAWGWEMLLGPGGRLQIITGVPERFDETGVSLVTRGDQGERFGDAAAGAGSSPGDRTRRGHGPPEPPGVQPRSHC